ncbi:MAG: Uma2 family endonuclease [Moraxellaceae bacterium]|nr:Uma2 family endonuclease [Moraxellaceae bacterium]MCP5176866.1 Uma2 family endonuclease [Moraxellaceae bacterium]
MSALQQRTVFISETEYLDGEHISDIKHEYIDGEVYAMSGASANHNRIAGNLYRKLGNHLDNQPCQPYTSDMKVKIGSKFFYPDVLVDCSNLSGSSYFTESPTLLVEVLSKSTRQIDEKLKRQLYTQIPTLQEYVLIEQDFVDVEIIRRRTGWQSEHYFLGEDVTLDAVDLTVSVEDIYYRVDNSDVKEWLEKTTQAAKQE